MERLLITFQKWKTFGFFLITQVAYYELIAFFALDNFVGLFITFSAKKFGKSEEM